MEKVSVKMSSNRSFGLLFFIVFLAISLWPLIYQEDLRLWAFILALIFFVLGILNSKFLTPLNKLWMKFGLFLGSIVAPFVMGVVFFMVVTPTSFFMRILGKDLLNLKYNNNKSYWINKTGPKSKMKNQF